MDRIDKNYNIVGVIKSQICSAIVNSESVRKALDFKGVDCTDFDPEDPFSLIYNCVVPWIQHPETISTTEALIFVGVRLLENYKNPYLLNANVSILCSVDKDDMKTSTGFFREDLLKNGAICYTKTDLIADEVTKCVSELSGTWIGDVEVIESLEYAMSATRYVRNLTLRLKDVNIGKLMQI